MRSLSAASLHLLLPRFHSSFLFLFSLGFIAFGRDETHKEWAKSFPTVLTELQEFVKKYHTTGVVWGGKVRALSLPSLSCFALLFPSTSVSPSKGVAVAPKPVAASTPAPAATPAPVVTKPAPAPVAAAPAPKKEEPKKEEPKKEEPKKEEPKPQPPAEVMIAHNNLCDDISSSTSILFSISLTEKNSCCG